MLFDSHTHLHFSQFDNDREEIIKKLCDFNIKIINVGIDLEDSKKAVDLAKKYPNQMWASAGFHPHNAAKTDINFDELKNLAKDSSVVGIGECGLDYAFFARERSEWMQKRAFAEAYGEGGFMEKEETKQKNLQKEIFIKQVELAKELKKPLIIHCRPTPRTMDAYEDALNIIQNYNNGVAHFFSGSKEIAKKFLDLGFYISFAGPITFHPSGGHPKGGDSPYEEIVKFIPNDRILAETDSPFAAPIPHCGKRNEPAFVEFVVRQIADWKELSFEEAARRTTENTENLFKLP